MKYKEHFTSYLDIINSDNITKEAYHIARKMYKTHWGWKDGVFPLTKEKLSIVYAFNMAVCLKESILNSPNHIETLKKEAGSLMHLSWKRKPHEVQWVYQRNTILGILYYLLSFTEGVDEKELECIKECARHLGIFPNEKGMVYMNDFIDAVKKKKEWIKNHDNVNKKKIMNPDRNMAQVIFNMIFRNGLDMEKIGFTLNNILNKEIRKGDPLFSQQRHWYIVYQWFLEICFIEKRRTAKMFREWAIFMFGNKGYSTENDFSEAKKIYNGNPFSWKPVVGHTDYICIRDYLSKEFNIEKRDEYVIKGRYIDWNLSKK